jgi:outer membrane protein
MWGAKERLLAAVVALCGALHGVTVAPSVAGAQTFEQALVQAYQNNPSLNAQRAATRAVDEKVPQALSGYRPTITGNADIGDQWARAHLAVSGITEAHLYPRGFGITTRQTLFNGFITGNQTRSAEAQVFAARETLRNTEQNTLLDAVTAYMNVLRDSALVELQKQNIEAVRELLRSTRERLKVGEVTRTDVAQAEARLAAAESALSSAQANLNASRAVYARVIGQDPAKLAPGRPIEQLLPAKLPTSLEAALASAFSQHPALAAARFGVDAASLQVRVAEGALYPTLSLEGALQRRWDLGQGIDMQTVASLIGRLTVPIFQGGIEYSRIREAKETLGQRRLEADVTRDQVRAAVVQSFGLLMAARFQVEAAHAQVRAAEVALKGVRMEADVGQRTTLDILNAQAELVNARSALVTAQRDRVVASYSLLAGMGRLSAAELKLNVAVYNPATHYHQIRDSWFGIRTPDGR